MRLLRRSTTHKPLVGTPVLSEKPLNAIRSSRSFPSIVAGRPRKSAVEQNDADGDLSQKAKEVREMQKRINHEYGKGTLMVLGDAPEKLVRFPTGLLSLDMILGGGLPKGRIFEIYGREGSGKTTLAIHLMTAAQQPDNYVYYVDTENAINPEYTKVSIMDAYTEVSLGGMQKMGLNWDRAILTQTGDGDQAFSIILEMIRSRVVDAICVDSVAGLVPPGEAEGDFSDITIAGLARMMSKAMKNVSNANSGVGEDDRVTMVFVNQIRENPGIHYGSPITRPGGHALKFASFITMEVRSGKPILDFEGNRIGHKMLVKLDKSKSARPFQSVELDLFYGEGLCKNNSLLDAAVSMAVVSQSGAYYKYGGETLGQGRAKAVERLKGDQALAKKLEKDTLLAFEEKGLDVAYSDDFRKEDADNVMALGDMETGNVLETVKELEAVDDATAPVQEDLISM